MGLKDPIFKRADEEGFHGGSDPHIKKQQYDAIQRGALRVIDVGASDVEHYNGTINDTPGEVSFTRRSSHVYIYNSDSAQELYVSFDGGATYFTLASGSDRLDLPVAVESIYLKGEATGTDYQVLVILDPIPQREPDPVAS